MTYSQRAWNFAVDVQNDKIVAGELVHLACDRFLADCARDDIYMSDDGERWCAFLEKLPHVKGRWAAQKKRFEMSDWQVFATVNLYGWKRADTHLRRFREGYIEVARKNGKSFWFGGLGVAHLTIDDEFGAEVYCGASTEAQAWEVFRPAKQICERTPALRSRFGIDVNAKSLIRLDNGSRFSPVIGNPGDGSSPSAAIADEFHEHKTSDQVDTFETGMGARDQPMMLYITTAGSDMGGPCYQKRADCIDILKGTVEDDAIFALIFCPDPDDDWTDEIALRKANPNFGVSVSAEFLKGKLEQAKRSAAKQNAFRTKHLNQWVGAKTAWMNMLAYQRQRRKTLSLKDFEGARCIAALDLASRVDIADLALLFEKDGKYAAFCKHYLPEDVINGHADVADRTNLTRYQEWHAGGWITATPGNVIDYGYIEEDLEEIKSRFHLIDVPYDPFQATQFATRMYDRGFPMVEYRQIVSTFSEPMKELEALILRKDIVFEMDPVLMWMFGNVVAQVDAKDCIYPRKERAAAKIDGVVALIMALGRWMFLEGDGYTVSRGVVVI